jgi:hypothetical protein
MEFLPRPIESCAFREDVRDEAGTETAHCGVLAKILEDGAPADSRVGRDACLACCQSQPPNGNQINPIIASMLYSRAGAGPHSADDADGRRWDRIRRMAERNLEAEIPLEESHPPWPRRALATCGYRGAALEPSDPAPASGCAPEPVFLCHHPAHETTTEAECRRCRDWAEVPGLAPPPLEQVLPPPEVRRGPRIGKWAVGVTTAPRRQETLSWCLDSLARAGWSAPRLFIDSSAPVPERFSHLPVTLRTPALGAWPNYYLGLAELMMREPAADAYFMVQDDSIFYDREDLSAYLDAALWPDEPVGAVSLYCPKIYTQPESGWHRRAEPWVYGALAFVFPRESAKRFIADLTVIEHRWSQRNEGRAQIDLVIGDWAQRSELPIYYPTPSLVQHIGDTSTLWPRARALGARKADRFAGDLG